MAVLSVSGIYKSFGDSKVLEDITFSVNKGDKVAIIGDNGEGKTTLLKIITKQLEADKGTIYFEDFKSVGYLSQHVIEDVSNTLLEEMELSFLKLKNMEEEMNILVEKMADSSDKELIDRYYPNYNSDDYLSKVKIIPEIEIIIDGRSISR